jgi:hypothetical protein
VSNSLFDQFLKDDSEVVMPSSLVEMIQAGKKKQFVAFEG